RRERGVGQFRRVVRLPGRLDPEGGQRGGPKWRAYRTHCESQGDPTASDRDSSQLKIPVRKEDSWMSPSDIEARPKQKVERREESTRPGTYFLPAVDIFETRDELVLVADMPGVPPDA